MGEKIIQHAVEEEARLMRVIMKNAKDESSQLGNEFCQR